MVITFAPRPLASRFIVEVDITVSQVTAQMKVVLQKETWEQNQPLDAQTTQVSIYFIHHNETCQNDFSLCHSFAELGASHI